MAKLIFDTETSGLPSNWRSDYTDLKCYDSCRMLSIAYKIIDKDNIIIKESYRVLNYEGTNGAEHINKLTRDIIDNGDNRIVVLNDIVNDINKFKVVELIAHNVSFDRTVLLSELYRESIHNNIALLNQYCTMKSAQLNMGVRRFPKLYIAYEHYTNTRLENSHNALADCNACFEIYKKLVE